MGWTISPPQSPPGPDGQVCFTVLGPTGAGTPTITISFDGDTAIRVRQIKSLGGGSYLVCFQKPPGVKTARVSVTGGREEPAVTFL